MLTVRKSRDSAYTSTITVTTLKTFGNNVTATFGFTFQNQNLSITLKLCDCFKYSWFQTFLKRHSNIISCPIVPGTYIITDCELPPRDFPIPVPNGVSKGLAYFSTGKEIIGGGTITLRNI
ncbi:unnamed protein product [Leptidea sinapis]|uniref:MD-2-related lipid-recognition domain-containing protein n=1 Tax=Leptidea sinapis TaxID=189913 RepID=A0A5E4QNU8_9NEOP|nr:unnamed protein product [Leptidea sinapis]